MNLFFGSITLDTESALRSLIANTQKEEAHCTTRDGEPRRRVIFTRYALHAPLLD